jgi:hypothetical protein
MVCLFIYSNGIIEMEIIIKYRQLAKKYAWMEPSAGNLSQPTCRWYNTMDYWYVVYLIKEMYKQSITHVNYSFRA